MIDLRRALLLTLLLCASQTLLAWHAPSHIELTDTGAGHVLSLQDCQLGVQAHAPALPGNGVQITVLPVRAESSPQATLSTLASHTLTPRARAPPVPLS